MRKNHMQVVERVAGDVIVLDLKGRLVFGDGDELFRDTLNRLIKNGQRKILLNLDQVNYIDSGGLGVLVSKYISLCKRDGHLKLCRVHGRPLKVLGITRLLTVFESFDSEEEALKTFG